MTRFLSATLAVMLFALGATGADGPIRIVTSPDSTTVIVSPVGEPTKLDVGKFLWVGLEGHTGNAVFWDIPAGSAVEKPSQSQDVLWGGWKQGDDRPRWHVVPAGSVPMFSAEKIDAGKFTFFEIPSLGRVGGTKQGEKSPAWHSPKSKESIPLLGVAKGKVTVAAWTTAGDVAKPETLIPKKLIEADFVVGDGDAIVNPGPGPAPSPGKSRKLAAYVVYESSDKSAKWSAFFSSKEVSDRWAAKGHLAPVLADQNVIDGKTKLPPAKLVPYLNRAKGKSLPQLYLIDAASGDVAFEGPAPDSPAEFLKLLDKVGG
jgi:hypothetical protein